MIIISKPLFYSLFLFVLVMFLGGCGIADGGKVTAKDVLKQEPDADLIQFDGFVYSNMTEVEWFKEDKDDYNKQNLLGEIKKQTRKISSFTDFSATNLPVGTKVYSTSLDENRPGVLIVEYEDEELYYMELLEG